MTNDQLEREALALPRLERARLAQRPMAGLEGGEELEQAWYDEAERRLASMESGEAADIPPDEVAPGPRPRATRGDG